MESNNNEREIKQIDFKLDGRNYYFDMDMACEFITNGVSEHDSNNARIEREIITNYDVETDDGGIAVNSKTVREITGPSDGTMDNIRYDLMKIMMIQIITFSDKTRVSIPNEPNGVDIPIICIDQLPLGTRLAFNTLLKAGIIKISEQQQEEK